MGIHRWDPQPSLRVGRGPGGLPKEYLSYLKGEWTSAKGKRSKEEECIKPLDERTPI